MMAKICDTCRKIDAVTYEVAVGTDFDGVETGKIYRRRDLCDKCAAASLKILLSKMSFEDGDKAGSLLGFEL